VFIRGDVDVAGAAALGRVLAELGDAWAGSVRADMGGIEFFGAAGARALGRSAHDLEAQGGRLTVERPGRSVRRVLEVTGLGRLLAA
jgi:anti-anti-sigma factor